ncbi:hypothetical protein ABZ766_16950 [Streptomyces sp. NPDC006670]|uniref:hypothetical protein n=1 Tax=Streptomyces sp. NPDC006670 TaxID=3154476 RepID=UPI003403AA22
MAPYVRGSRAAALSAAKTLVPTSRLGAWGPAQGARAISALPALLRLTTGGGRLHDSVTVADHLPSHHERGLVAPQEVPEL